MDKLSLQSESFWETVDKVMTSEAEVEQRLLLPLLAALGYADNEITPKARITFQTGRKGRKHEADLLVHRGSRMDEDTSLIVVEAKAPGQDLEQARRQAESYAHATRAPFLLLTDGTRLEIWQMQTTGRSEQAFACAVRNLLRHRGRIERLIGRSAAIVHCRTLGYKPLEAAVDDIGAYVESELTRLTDRLGIARRLRVAGTASAAIAALAEGRGAIVLAPSGYGKTTLAIDLHRHCLATLSEIAPVPFLIPLSDLAELDQAPQDYARDRMAARCPHFASTAAFSDLLEMRGARLICDGLDRIGPDAQRRFLARARILQRDRPKVSLIILGRTEIPNELGIPNLELLPLDRAEQQALATLVHTGRGAMAIHSLPTTLEPIVEHPLLLTLLLQHMDRQGSIPSRLDDLFETWLRQLLEARGDGPAAVARMRDLLSRFAVAVGGATRSRVQVLGEVGIGSDETFDALVHTGVLVMHERIELLHETLGDHLRAEVLAALSPEGFRSRLTGEIFAKGSLFPALLMSKCQDSERRDILWDRLLAADLEVYLDVLRFGGEPDHASGTDAAVSAAYVKEFRAGIVQPARRYMSPLERPLYAALTWRPTEQLGVRGCVDPDGRWFTYEFYPVRDADPSIAIGAPGSHSPSGGFNLHSDVGGYNARNKGFETLRGALANVIRRRQLEGGAAWLNERLLGRLRFAARKWRLDLPLDADFEELSRQLASKQGQVVYLDGFGDYHFSVEDMLEDIRSLRAQGRSSAEPWWERFGLDPALPDADPEFLYPLLDEFWRRSQVVYRELVLHSFPALENSLDFNVAMPVRYTVRIHDIPDWGRATEYLWRPVAQWSQAGADVEYGWKGLYTDVAFAETMSELARLGRSGCTSTSYVQGSIPRFDGAHRRRGFDGETAVLRNALAMLVDDLDRLFGRLSRGGSMKNQCIVGA